MRLDDGYTSWVLVAPAGQDSEFWTMTSWLKERASAVVSTPIEPAASPPAGQSYPTPVTTTPSAQITATFPFKDGLADRGKWESWFATTIGDFRNGAEYWAGQRSRKAPGSCEALSSAPAIAGCQAAKNMLAPMDLRRKTDADYRAGWNSYNG
jgi:hypothetical protein